MMLPRRVLPPPPVDGRVVRVIGGRLWRALLHLRFLLWQRHRHNRVVVEQVAGKAIVVLPDVMNPVLFMTGEYLASLLTPSLFAPGAGMGRERPQRVLDMGCGSGICALFAAAIAPRVVAVDVNPAAVRCARINVLLHQLEARVEVRQGDLFAPVQGERFDLVLFNPPYLPGEPRTEFERALRSGNVIARFAANLRDHLAERGVALVLFSSLADHTHHLDTLRAHGLQVEVFARRQLLSETLTVYRLCLE